ncbi:hypothetical protein [Vitiosangium sp. GDMCC 1.1324]|uniref:hypothetical protein n=1 Tax=Vitiosangium sp. (strain GDMCC 1.1324) TaxID=2138576 RepID=UPI0011B4E2A3|nr:hypothetical protein [Vitiosangium sp. GDMCC 1.1324]
MRILGMSAVGIVTLLGSPAWADLPVVQEAHAAREGCDYSIRVEQDVDPKAAHPVCLLNSWDVESILPAAVRLAHRLAEHGRSVHSPVFQDRHSSDGCF